MTVRYLKMGLFLIITAVFLSSCGPRQSRTVQRSFYYWKSEFRLDQRETATLRQLRINRLYLKFFDVVWDDSGNYGPVPASTLRFVNRPPRFAAVVPTIYITNETMSNLATGQVADLAHKIYSKVERMVELHHLQGVAEVQLDCDWTLQTRAKYFQLLQVIRSRLARRGIRLSATIRLHQIKYRKLTGIPPVDRGMLMFYNLTPVKEFGTDNSILNVAVGKTYTADLQTYPLPLDVALPIFSWGVIFQDDHFIGLANDFSLRELRANSNFEVFRINYPQRPAAHFFRVKRDVCLHQVQLYRGDLIRVEESEARALRECALYLSRRLPAAPPADHRLNVALFHLDPLNLRRIGDAEITNLFDSFR